MKKEAVDLAKARLRKAISAAAAFKAATNFDEADEAWTDFLLACAAIYSKLEQGAKGGNKSEPWYGNKKHERNSDPLLRYLHHARNSEEHGIERVTRTDIGSDYHRKLKFNERVPIKIQRYDTDNKTPIGDELDGVIAGPTIRLITVNNRRHNVICDPPATHLGDVVPFGADFPDALMSKAIDYLTKMIDEAEQLIS